MSDEYKGPCEVTIRAALMPTQSYALCFLIQRFEVISKKLSYARLVFDEAPKDKQWEPIPWTLTLDQFSNAGQTLMDDLWAAGIRPKANVGTTGQIAAMEMHVESLRNVAYSLLGIATPPKPKP